MEGKGQYKTPIYIVQVILENGQELFLSSILFENNFENLTKSALYSHLLSTKLAKILATALHFNPFLKLVQIYFIFANYVYHKFRNTAVTYC